VLGRLAERPPRPGQPLRGVLVRQEGGDALLHPDDLAAYTRLSTGSVLQRQAIPLDRSLTEVRLALEIMFEGGGPLTVRSSPSPPPVAASAAAAAAAATAAGGGDAARFDTARLRVGELVDVVYREGNPEAGYERHVVVEWAGGPAGDLVADAVVAVLLQAAGEPLAAAEAETARRDALAAGDKAGAAAAELSLLAALLGAQFGVAVADVEAGVVRVAVDKAAAVVDPRSAQVACDDDALRGRLERALERAVIAMRPAAVDADRPM